MADYQILSPRYRLGDRLRDHRNARKDRAKDIVNYRKNRNTRYLSFLKSELAFQIKKEQGRCREYTSFLQGQLTGLTNTLQHANDAEARLLAQLKSKKAEYSAEEDYVARAVSEREIRQLSDQLTTQKNNVRELEKQIEQIKEAQKTAAELSEKNCQSLQGLYAVRMDSYVNMLFKKEKRKQREVKK